jgi:hypothetical protein
MHTYILCLCLCLCLCVCVCARARACERAKVMAEDYEEVATLEAGDIGAVAGLKRTTRNPKP